VADPSAGQTTYVTVREVAEELRISSQTVYRLIDSGELPALRLGHRTYRIPAEDYAAYKAKLHTDAYKRVRDAGLPPHIPGQGEFAV
jgi:excisionase family DNA binding protein